MAAALIPIGAGLAEGIGQGLMGQAAAKQQAQQVKAQQQQSQGQEALQVQQSLDAAPLRDRAMYMLQQRLGMTPGQFKPHDIYNQNSSAVTPQYGGYNQQALAQANQAYQPGMGNVNTAVGDQYINKLGYNDTTTNPLGTATGQPTVNGGDFARQKAAQMAAAHPSAAGGMLSPSGEDPSQQAMIARIRSMLGD